jgi:hypothetical protein
MLDTSANSGLAAVLRALGLVDLAALAHALIGEVTRLRRLGRECPNFCVRGGLLNSSSFDSF